MRAGKVALPEPRVVQLVTDNGGRPRFAYTENFFSREHLLTCWESHSVFPEHYHRLAICKELAQPSDKYGRHWDNRSPYFDEIRDTLVATVSHVQKLGSELGASFNLSRVQNLGLSGVLQGEGTIWGLARALCPNLKIFSEVMGFLFDEHCPRSRLRLIEADDNLRYDELSPHEYLPTSAFIFDARIMSRVNDAKAMRNDFNRYLEDSEETWNNIEYRVSLAGMESWNDFWRNNLSFDVRKPISATPQFTLKPVFARLFAEIELKCFKTRCICDKDGELQSHYDGIKELFEPANDEDRAHKALDAHLKDRVLNIVEIVEE